MQFPRWGGSMAESGGPGGRATGGRAPRARDRTAGGGLVEVEEGRGRSRAIGSASCRRPPNRRRPWWGKRRAHPDCTFPGFSFILNEMERLTEKQLMTRAAWLYYIAGLNQEAASQRMGLSRARVNKLLQQARESGLVSILIDERDLGLLPVEDAIMREFGLDLCRATPAYGLSEEECGPGGPLAKFPFRAVGAATASYLREQLVANPDLTIGTGWGRTLASASGQFPTMHARGARFVSLMGSLTANSAFNPFEVVQSFAQVTGGQGFFLPVPFIADSPEDRTVLLSQRIVARPLELARYTDLALLSVGELTEDSLLRQQDMITADELRELHQAGAVGDTNGLFFDRTGRPVEHPLNGRTIAASLQDLARSRAILLSAGRQKIEATEALLRSGAIKGLIIDGDSAEALAQRCGAGRVRRAVAEPPPRANPSPPTSSRLS